MFKALDSRTNTDIVILDAEWIGRIAELRALGRQDVLVCPGCLQPVHTRAGGFKRPHFAHKHLGACTYDQVSPALLDARAALYEWLSAKFGSGVSLEKKLDDERLPRPIDCWVEREGGSLAYWILDARLAPEKRDGLKKGFSQLGVGVNWVFVAAMLREDELVTGGVHLTTTEREFIQPSEYDAALRNGGPLRNAAPARDGGPTRHYLYGIKGTLHYLDPDEQTLTTFRALRLYHEPQLYQGRREKNDLADVQVLGKTGEFVHPGEYERLKKHLQQAARAGKEQPRKPAIPPVCERGPAIPPSSVASPPAQPVMPPLPKIVAEMQRDASAYPQAFQPEEATCMLCGQRTTDWWYLDGATKTCKCRECLEQGSA